MWSTSVEEIHTIYKGCVFPISKETNLSIAYYLLLDV